MERENLLYKARLAEKAERFFDMIETIKQVAVLDDEINAEERNLFSVAYKNELASKRLAWRTVSTVEQAEESEGAHYRIEGIRIYLRTISEEIETLCNEVLSLIEKHLLPKAKESEAKVYFLKMKADYYRYLAEIKSGEERTHMADTATVAYKEATELAVAKLTPTNPIRLGLALNFSVFIYEILNTTDRACRLARAAFDDAVSELDMLSEDTYKDATLIMQLLRDNLALWTEDGPSEQPNDDVDT